MSDGDKGYKSPRIQGREKACEGILLSHLGKRPSAAGTKALLKLRSEERIPGPVRWFAGRSLPFRLGIAAAVVAAAILLLHALTGSEAPEAPGGGLVRVAPDPDDREVAGNPDQRRVTPRKPMSSRREEKLASTSGDNEQKNKGPVAPDRDEQTAAVATIRELAGDVRVRHTGSEEWRETGAFFSIMPGDTLSTNSLGQARLDFKGGDHLYVNSDAQLTVEKGDEEFLFRIDRGEVYLEKDSVQGCMAFDTGFGSIRSRRGRFHLKKYDKGRYMLHVLEGEVECHERGGKHSGKYGGRMQAMFEKGQPCAEGTKFESEDDFMWAMVEYRFPRRMARGHRTSLTARGQARASRGRGRRDAGDPDRGRGAWEGCSENLPRISTSLTQIKTAN